MAIQALVRANRHRSSIFGHNNYIMQEIHTHTVAGVSGFATTDSFPVCTGHHASLESPRPVSANLECHEHGSQQHYKCSSIHTEQCFFRHFSLASVVLPKTRTVSA